MMTKGTVLLFKADKGYGFIQPEDGSANVYVHVSTLDPSILESFVVGALVTYDIHTEDGKTSAVNVSIAQ